jgi:hypothetical protein
MLLKALNAYGKWAVASVQGFREGIESLKKELARC